MYIKQKEEAPKTVPSKYTKEAQRLKTEGEGIETKHITFPYLKPNQSKKLTREEGLKTYNT